MLILELISSVVLSGVEYNSDGTKLDFEPISHRVRKEKLHRLY